MSYLFKYIGRILCLLDLHSFKKVIGTSLYTTKCQRCGRVISYMTVFGCDYPFTVRRGTSLIK